MTDNLTCKFSNKIYVLTMWESEFSRGYFKNLDDYIQYSIDQNEKNRMMYALEWVTFYNKFDYVKIISNYIDSLQNDFTVLFNACDKGYFEIVKFIVEKFNLYGYGFNVDYDIINYALYNARNNNFHDICNYLIENNVCNPKHKSLINY